MSPLCLRSERPHSYLLTRLSSAFFSTFSLLTLLLTINALPLTASAEGGLSQAAVQNRAPIDPYEWSLSAGMLPLDAFKKGITASGSLTLHYDHLWAWEAAQLTHSFEYKTALEDVLRAQGGLEATPFERVQTYVTSNVVFKPLYWKGAWMNQGLSYGELFFVAGGGYGWLTQSSRPVVDAGVGVRLFQGEWSARLDVRWLSFFNADDAQGELWVALGVSL